MSRIQKWSEFYSDSEMCRLKWPSEMMVITMMGSIESFSFNWQGDEKVLDVGCGSGNNLIPFLDQGLECHGVEISKEILDVAKTYLNSRGYNTELRIGDNKNIPYDDEYFDVVTSVNVLHYEQSAKDIMEALKEYARVLRPGGILYLSTTGPNHAVYQAAKVLDNHCYQFLYDDFRKGETFFYFDNEKYLQYFLEKIFSKTVIGRNTMSMPGKFQQDYLIAVAQR